MITLFAFLIQFTYFDSSTGFTSAIFSSRFLIIISSAIFIAKFFMLAFKKMCIHIKWLDS